MGLLLFPKDVSGTPIFKILVRTLYETEFVLFLVVLENSVLPMGSDSSNETLYVMSFVYKPYLGTITSRKTPNDIRSWPSYHVDCKCPV